MARRLISVLAGMALMTAPLPAIADDAKPAPAAPAKSETGPLAPAGAAGVKEAQANAGIPWVFVTGFSIVAVAVGLALAHHESTTSTTATTGTD
jgi:hypothetical protein